MQSPRLPALVLSLALTAIPAVHAQTSSPAPQGSDARSGRPTVPRDDWQRAPDIFTALGAKAGSRIADLGAGEGWLTTRLARHVGPDGRVFASDISTASLDKLARTLAKDSLRNVELILAEDDDPRLPYGTLDGVVILNAYHEMPKWVAVLEGIKRALRPEGTLVIVDNTPHKAVKARKDQAPRHTLALDFVRNDLEAHGFEIISADAGFIDRATADHGQGQWMLVARRPGK